MKLTEGTMIWEAVAIHKKKLKESTNIREAIAMH